MEMYPMTWDKEIVVEEVCKEAIGTALWKMALWRSGMHGKRSLSFACCFALSRVSYLPGDKPSSAQHPAHPGSQGLPRAMTISLTQSVALPQMPLFCSLPLDVEQPLPVVPVRILFRCNSLLRNLAELSSLHSCSEGANLAVWLCWL